MASKIWRNLIRTAAAACFVAGSSAQAGGVFYQSDFDPLGFAGSAKWYVDDNCNLRAAFLAEAPAVRSITGGVNDPGIRMQRFAFEAFGIALGGWRSHVADARLGNDKTLVTVAFASEPEVDPKLVAGIFVWNGALAGVDTFMIRTAAVRQR